VSQAEAVAVLDAPASPPVVETPQFDEGPPSAHPYRAAVRAFGTVAEALGKVQDLDALLHLIAMQASKLAGARRCSVYLRDHESDLFHGQVGYPEEVADADIKRLVAGVPADRFTREIVESRRPVVLSNALDDPRPIRSTMRAWNIRSMLGVPMVLRGEVIGIVFLDDAGESRAFSPEECELASTFADLAAVAISQARMTAELRASVELASKQNRLLRRAAATDERLSRLVLEGGDLQEIANAVAELTHKPTSIHDAHHNRLALAMPPGQSSDVIPRLLDPPFRRHPLVGAALERIAATRGGIVGPLPTAGLPQRFLLAAVTIRDEELGHLVVMEYGCRFGPLDTHIVRSAATNIALEVAAERRAARAEWDARASLAADLIHGNSHGAPLGRRARYLGVDLTAARVLCLLATGPSGQDAMPIAADVSTALADGAADRSVLATDVPEGVVALLELPPGLPTMEAIAAARARVEGALERLGGGRIFGAISTRCAEAGDYVRAYEEARQVMRCRNALCGESGVLVLTADDLGPGRLVLASAERADATRFAHDALGALLCDEEGAHDLLATLQAFFEHGRSVRRSARALRVHENTIRYRLTRIEDRTGLAVAHSSDDQLTAQLALLVLRLEGALPQAAARAPAPVA
jgi:sugar diacid utilization regulator/GAF domain-containing protein